MSGGKKSGKKNEEQAKTISKLGGTEVQNRGQTFGHLVSKFILDGEGVFKNLYVPSIKQRMFEKFDRFLTPSPMYLHILAFYRQKIFDLGTSISNIIFTN